MALFGKTFQTRLDIKPYFALERKNYYLQRFLGENQAFFSCLREFFRSSAGSGQLKILSFCHKAKKFVTAKKNAQPEVR
jgi:hypothetical protein